uniref:m7GpppX diphosphatase n=1 Tax=Glossina palpalis gambiensis TaxID=67801 RepID=A0A1B0BF45_9MUSC
MHVSLGIIRLVTVQFEYSNTRAKLSDMLLVPCQPFGPTELYRTLKCVTERTIFDYRETEANITHDTDKAVVIFEKQAFRESEVATESDQSEKQLLEKNCKNNVKDTSLMSYFCSDLTVQTEFINDIDGSYQCVPPVELSGVKTIVIYPASQKHIEKYTVCQKFIIISESPELYEEITLPYISTSQHSLEWVYNILDHKQEVERIVYENPDPETGFILLPDLK